MADKNYIKALRRAKARRNFYAMLMAFIPTGILLFMLNVTLIVPYIPWSMIPITILVLILLLYRALLLKRPQRTVFDKDYIEYQTEKELRLLEFEDEMDEMDAEKLELGQLDLHSYRRDLDEGLV